MHAYELNDARHDEPTQFFGSLRMAEPATMFSNFCPGERYGQRLASKLKKSVLQPIYILNLVYTRRAHVVTLIIIFSISRPIVAHSSPGQNLLHIVAGSAMPLSEPKKWVGSSWRENVFLVAFSESTQKLGFKTHLLPGDSEFLIFHHFGIVSFLGAPSLKYSTITTPLFSSKILDNPSP